MRIFNIEIDPQVFWDTARFLFGNENLMAWRAMGGNNKIN